MMASELKTQTANFTKVIAPQFLTCGFDEIYKQVKSEVYRRANLKINRSFGSRESEEFKRAIKIIKKNYDVGCENAMPRLWLLLLAAMTIDYIDSLCGCHGWLHRHGSHYSDDYPYTICCDFENDIYRPRDVRAERCYYAHFTDNDFKAYPYWEVPSWCLEQFSIILEKDSDGYKVVGLEDFLSRVRKKIRAENRRVRIIRIDG